MMAVTLSMTLSVNAASVVIGQATNGENGRLSGCVAGDQSGKEVSTSSWGYSSSPGSSYHWVYVFRPKNPEVAKKMAETMKKIAANNHVGYDKKQPDRCTLYDEAKKKDWDVSKITKNCETTCASAVSVCINSAGIKTPRMWYSGIVYKDIMKTKQFYCYKTSDYTASSKKLLPGDVLLNPKRHTAMVVESPNKFLFQVKYKNTKGKAKTALIEENKYVKINTNDGENLISLKVNQKRNLKKYAPERKGSEFKGWKRTTNNSFTAQYKNQKSSIFTGNSKIKLD